MKKIVFLTLLFSLLTSCITIGLYRDEDSMVIRNAEKLCPEEFRASVEKSIKEWRLGKHEVRYVWRPEEGEDFYVEIWENGTFFGWELKREPSPELKLNLEEAFVWYFIR